MKRILTLMLALSCLSFQASAQSGFLGGLLGGLAGAGKTDSAQNGGGIEDILTGLLNQVVGANTDVSLAGKTYSYKSSVVALTSSQESILGGVATTTINSQIQNKVDQALGKVGIAEDALQFKFEKDGSFTCNIKNLPLSGKYTQDGNKISMEFGKNMKYLTMEGAVVNTVDGVQMAFTSDKYLQFVKNLLSYINAKGSNATVNGISTALSSYDGLNLGFNLKK